MSAPLHRSSVPLLAMLLALPSLMLLTGAALARGESSPVTAPAKPAGTLVTKTDTESVSGKHFAFGRAVAKCPAGYGILSGGAEINDSATLQLAENYPTLHNSWIAAAVQPAFFFGAPAPTPGQVTAYAICSKDAKAVVAGSPAPAGRATTVYVKRPASIPGLWSSSVSQEAKCPEGYRILSGGADIDDTAYPWITESQPDFNGPGSWKVTVTQPALASGVNDPAPGGLNVYAICTKAARVVIMPGGASPAPAVAAAPYKWSTVKVPLPKGWFRLAKVQLKCETGYRVIGGGAVIGLSDFAHIAQSFPVAKANAWVGAAVQPRFGAAPAPAGNLLVAAICAKRGVALKPGA